MFNVYSENLLLFVLLFKFVEKQTQRNLFLFFNEIKGIREQM